MNVTIEIAVALLIVFVALSSSIETRYKKGVIVVKKEGGYELLKGELVRWNLKEEKDLEADWCRENCYWWVCFDDRINLDCVMKGCYEYYWDCDCEDDWPDCPDHPTCPICPGPGPGPITAASGSIRVADTNVGNFTSSNLCNCQNILQSNSLFLDDVDDSSEETYDYEELQKELSRELEEVEVEVE